MFQIFIIGFQADDLGELGAERSEATVHVKTTLSNLKERDGVVSEYVLIQRLLWHVAVVPVFIPETEQVASWELFVRCKGLGLQFSGRLLWLKSLLACSKLLQVGDDLAKQDSAVTPE